MHIPSHRRPTLTTGRRAPRIPARPAVTRRVRRVVLALLAAVAVALGPVGSASACIKPPIRPHVPVVVKPPHAHPGFPRRPHVPTPPCATPPGVRPPCATPPVVTPPPDTAPPATTPPVKTPPSTTPRPPARCADGTPAGPGGCDTVTTPPSFTG